MLRTSRMSALANIHGSYHLLNSQAWVDRTSLLGFSCHLAPFLIHERPVQTCVAYIRDLCPPYATILTSIKRPLSVFSINQPELSYPGLCWRAEWWTKRPIYPSSSQHSLHPVVYCSVVWQVKLQLFSGPTWRPSRRLVEEVECSRAPLCVWMISNCDDDWDL
jgi:hypothetical protein